MLSYLLTYLLTNLLTYLLTYSLTCPSPSPNPHQVEEIQEMMPIHPAFQRKAVRVHMDLYLKEQSLMSLHKITPQDLARGPRKGADFLSPRRVRPKP